MAPTTAIERESRERTGLRSDVLALYNGGEYWLYRYKRFTDLRLVFAPEEQMAYFGGDYDNFTFPRHDLDVTFLRAYENGQPARTEHYLRWSAGGVTENEFVVLAGYPVLDRHGGDLTGCARGGRSRASGGARSRLRSAP